MRTIPAAAVLPALLLASPAAAGADEPLSKPAGARWPADRRVSVADVDHAPFTALLAKYVDGDGFVDYRRWHASAEDRTALKNYLKRLSRVDAAKPAPKAAKLAYWINAYNALTLEGILRVYPTKSIRDHTPKLFGTNIWDDFPLAVGATQYSLNDIEHKILRKLGDPRIHFAIVCASVGCPTLRAEAYTSEAIDRQLDEQARDFFAREKHFSFDAASDTVTASKILSWFGEDFGEDEAAVLARVRPYLPAAVREAATAPGVTVRYRSYDWSLNDRASR